MEAVLRMIETIRSREGSRCFYSLIRFFIKELFGTLSIVNSIRTPQDTNHSLKILTYIVRSG